MLLIIAVLVLVAAAFLLVSFRRRANPELPREIKEVQFASFEPPLGARPLFAPSDEELRIEAAEIEAREIAKREYRARSESREKVDAALAAFRTWSDRHSTTQLLRVAAEDGLDRDLSRAATEVIKLFHEDGITGLTDSDLAALIDSHISLLSNEERGSGASFWLKQEVARLRER